METLKYSRATIMKVIPGEPSEGYSDFILQDVSESQSDDITVYKTNPSWWIKKTKNKPVIKRFSGIIPDYNRDPDMTFLTEEEEQENELKKYVEIFIDKYKNEWRASVCLNSADGTLIQVIYKDRKVFGYILDLRIAKEKGKFTSFIFSMMVISEETVESMDIDEVDDGFDFYRDMNYENSEWKSYINQDGADNEERFSNYILVALTRTYAERLSISTYGEKGSVRVVSFGAEPVTMMSSIVVDDYKRDDVISEQEFIRHYNEEFRGKGVSLLCGEDIVNGIIVGVSSTRKWKHGSLVTVNMIEKV